nr:hypothetical protein [Pseudomonas sp. CCOS 191]
MPAMDRIFHDLHQQELLMLANVADAGGARLVGSVRVAAFDIHGFLHGAMRGLIQRFLQSGQLETSRLKAHSNAELNALMAPPQR